MADQPRLGRGLASLLGQSTGAEITEQGLRQIAVADLKPNPQQPRADFDEASLAELIDSIRRTGVLQPLLVRPAPDRPAMFEIVAGERRWRAARGAGLQVVPCVVRTLSDREASLAAMIENLQREDLSPLDEARGFQMLMQLHGLTQDELARSVGKSRSHVANTLRLLGLPRSVQDAVRDRRLTAGHARALLSHADPEAAAALVIGQGLSVRQTENLTLPARGLGTEPRPSRPVDPDIDALTRALSERLGLSVRIQDRGGQGRVVIEYRSLEQLDGVVARLDRD